MREDFGDISVLETVPYLYGMAPGNEYVVTLDQDDLMAPTPRVQRSQKLSPRPPNVPPACRFQLLCRPMCPLKFNAF